MHELGVRIALGAQNMDVARLVVSHALGLAVTGIVLGTAIALLGARWIQPLLFRQSASDPAVFIIVGVALALVAVAASAAPAWRATRADPNTVLRTD
jgi:ABC-type antimicrobial peptide transport system permease subunit